MPTPTTLREEKTTGRLNGRTQSHLPVGENRISSLIDDWRAVAVTGLGLRDRSAGLNSQQEGECRRRRSDLSSNTYRVVR